MAINKLFGAVVFVLLFVFVGVCSATRANLGSEKGASDHSLVTGDVNGKVGANGTDQTGLIGGGEGDSDGGGGGSGSAAVGEHGGASGSGAADTFFNFGGNMGGGGGGGGSSNSAAVLSVATRTAVAKAAVMVISGG
ncbi:hypothetical protein CCACVL1_15096 [Corchorus capsularis]|uniref:Uncharacterized protein n=1 Tax=Corchorus capsularis TaxID=210143 RepID=A0A1R3I409_COCAP|nr:hypothetical protein CCACVL1_15096 [Corchorus capsularis]